MGYGQGLLPHQCAQEIAAGLHAGAEEIEGIADGLWARAGSFWGLFDAAGVRFRVEHKLPGGIRGIYYPGPRLVLVRPARTERELAGDAAHELGHAVLPPRLHTHGDVWHATLALLMPRALARTRGATAWDLHGWSLAPPWAALLRASQPQIRELL